MDASDLSTVECLRLLLEVQARKAGAVAQRIESLNRSGALVTQPSSWAGSAREAHDAAAQSLLASLSTAWHAAAHAADESARAAATLSGRVR